MAAQEEIEELRRKLSRLGSVNLEALQELGELENRSHSLSIQFDDLTSAKLSLEEIISKIKEAGARVVLCTPTVIGEKKSNKLDAQLDEYADVSRKVAKETGVALCDLRKAFREYLEKHNADDKEKGVLTGDRVHLNDAGNQFVADTILATIDK